MKAIAHIKLLMALLLLSCSCVAQNLVPNYSFEDTLHCPDDQGQIYNASSWFQPTTGTPDYFNECSISMHVPNNGVGFQYPKTGKAFAGFKVYNTGGLSYREYIEAPLISTLIASKKYCVTFYVSLSEISNIAIDVIGLYFSNNSITSNNDLNLLYLPQIKNLNGTMLNDTVNWILISGEYIAGGGEKFITIGNFNDDGNTNTELLSGTPFGGTYYTNLNY